MNNEQVMAMAHRQASKYSKTTLLTSVVGQKIVDVADFRAFLIQLFAISLMWVHFKNADSWLEGERSLVCSRLFFIPCTGNDVGNDTLNLTEFQLACRSFCNAHQREEPTEEQMINDFKLLDKNNSNNISFVEICNYCCKFVDPTREDALHMIDRSTNETSNKLTAVLNESFYHSNRDNDDEQLPLVSHPRIEFDQKNNQAMDALMDSMNKNQAIAEFVEIKMNTQQELGIRHGDSSTLMDSLSEKNSSNNTAANSDDVTAAAPPAVDAATEKGTISSPRLSPRPPNE